MSKCEVHPGGAFVQLMVCAGCLLTGVAFSSHIVNYDNHPDLEKAMQYDMSIPEADVTKASRELAEKHYLAYLKDVNESETFQQARVYVKLGDMFYGRVVQEVLDSDKDRNRKEDYKKAQMYYRMALAKEPNRICRGLINARAALSTLELEGGQRLDGMLDYYAWVTSIDRDTLKTSILPAYPQRIIDQQVARREAERLAREKVLAELRRMQRENGHEFQKLKSGVESAADRLMMMLSSQEEVTRINYIHEAKSWAGDERGFSFVFAIENLQKAIKRFPDSDLAKDAKKEVAYLFTR